MLVLGSCFWLLLLDSSLGFLTRTGSELVENKESSSGLTPTGGNNSLLGCFSFGCTCEGINIDTGC